MKHIKTPVDQGATFECDIYDQVGLIAICKGQTPLAEQRATELVSVINEYDVVVAQRDALAEACHAFLERAGREHTDYADFRVVQDMARAALAFVDKE